MDKKLEILIVEDDEKTCKRFVEYCDELENAYIIGVTNNARNALAIVEEKYPDVIILDLELHFGEDDGLTLLQALKKSTLPIKPYVIITSYNSSPVTLEAARELGADFIMQKHQTNYSEKKVIDFALMLKDTIHKNQKNNNNFEGKLSVEQQTKRLNKIINNEINKVGVNPKMIGYQYLTRAITLVINQPQSHICATISKEVGKTEDSVQRAMQNAINKAWHTCDIDELLEHYTAKIASTRGVPTITEFIFFFANKIKNQY